MLISRNEILYFRQKHTEGNFELYFDGKLDFCEWELLLEYAREAEYEKIRRNISGCYLIYIKDNNNSYLFTDFLGRMPLYFNPFTNQYSNNLENFDLIKDSRNLIKVIKFGYLCDNITPYSNIFKVNPREIMIFDETLGVDCIETSLIDIFKDETYNFKEIMQTFIDYSLVNYEYDDIAVLLSGGLDSSIIHYHIKNSKYYNPNKVNFYCMDYENEYQHAKLLESDIKLLKVEESDEILKEAIKIQKTPYDLGSLIPQYNLFKNIKETVIFTGDGSDEMFGGYRRQFKYDAQLSDIFDELPNYHFPRIYEMAKHFDKTVVSPFLLLDFLNISLSLPYSERINKKYLRDLYKNDLPIEIIERKKQPLKSKNVLDNDAENYRIKLVEIFKNI